MFEAEGRVALVTGGERGIGRAIEIAAAVVFLASEEAGYITGEILDINGGLYID